MLRAAQLLRRPAVGVGCTGLRASARSVPRRWSSTNARTDGFNEALPRRDVLAPIVCCGIYGFAWMMAEEGTVKSLVESVEMNADPNAWPTPKQLASHLWPFFAGHLAMLFESVACKFAATDDFRWLCTDAMNDDIKATVALCLVTAPAEHSPAFVRAVAEQGTLRRVNEIVMIYKTLPREQHDDVLTNACVLAAKVAAIEDLRDSGLALDDFLWMLPTDKACLYAPYGMEGLSHLWQTDPTAFLLGGGVGRVAALAAGPPLRPSLKESTAANQELAQRLLCRFNGRSEELRKAAAEAEARLVKATAAAGASTGKRTIWQATGVHRGETELEIAHRRRREQLANVRTAQAELERLTSLSPHTFLERFSAAVSIGCTALIGFGYGAARAYLRGWWQDVTPSVCRELSMHVGRRTAVGAALLVAAYEAAPALKAQLLEKLGHPPVSSYAQEGALKQLVGVDGAYLGLLALMNFAFPYILLPVAFNPTQLLIPPNDCLYPKAEAADK